MFQFFQLLRRWSHVVKNKVNWAHKYQFLGLWWIYPHAERGLYLYRAFLVVYKPTDYHIKILFLSSQLLKIQDLNIVNLCSYMTHANDPDRFLKTADGFTFSLEERFFAVEFSHYAGSTEPTKNLDLDIMHKIQDGEQVNRSDVTKFVRARFHNVTDQQVFKVSSLTWVRLFQNQLVLVSLIVVDVLSIVCIRTTHDTKTLIHRL